MSDVRAWGVATRWQAARADDHRASRASAGATSSSTSSSAASATPTSTRRATAGRARCSPWCPVTRSPGGVTKVGTRSRFHAGDLAGVGCMVDSCRRCAPCTDGLEQFCEQSPAYTYNSTEMDRKTPTYGGYSTQIVVDDRYVLRIPEGLDPAGAAPLLCAGITTYSPLRQWGCKAGDRVGVVGLGGLGHMAVKLAASMGAKVRAQHRRQGGRRPPARRHGLRGDPGRRRIRQAVEAFDLVIDTVSAPHDYDAYLQLLRPRGTMVVVGVPPSPTPVRPARARSSTATGGLRDPSSAASRRPRRCSTTARSTGSSRTSRSSPSRRSTRRTSASSKATSATAS